MHFPGDGARSVALPFRLSSIRGGRLPLSALHPTLGIESSLAEILGGGEGEICVCKREIKPNCEHCFRAKQEIEQWPFCSCNEVESKLICTEPEGIKRRTSDRFDQQTRYSMQKRLE